MEATSTGGRTVTTRQVNTMVSGIAEGQAIIGRLKRQAESGRHANPPLVIYGNPPLQGRKLRPVHSRSPLTVVGQLSDDVHAILYTHVDDGKDYRHDFEGAASMFAVERAGKRDVLVTGPKPLWGDF